MTSPTLGELRRRVDALEERRQAGPLSAAERQELDALEADYAAKFPMPIDEMSDTKLEEFLKHHRSDAAGRSSRAVARNGRGRPAQCLREDKARGRRTHPRQRVSASDPTDQLGIRSAWGELRENHAQTSRGARNLACNR